MLKGKNTPFTIGKFAALHWTGYFQNKHTSRRITTAAISGNMRKAVPYSRFPMLLELLKNSETAALLKQPAKIL